MLEFPEPYSQPIDFTFCGVYVVTVFLNKTGTTAAATLGAAALSGFFYSDCRRLSIFKVYCFSIINNCIVNVT